MLQSTSCCRFDTFRFSALFSHSWPSFESVCGNVPSFESVCGNVAIHDAGHKAVGSTPPLSLASDNCARPAFTTRSGYLTRVLYEDKWVLYEG
jgi:hypothetical protein